VLVADRVIQIFEEILALLAPLVVDFDGNVAWPLFAADRPNKVVANGKSVQSGRTPSKRIIGIGQGVRVGKEEAPLAEPIRRDLGGEIAGLKAAIPSCRHRGGKTTIRAERIAEDECPEGTSVIETTGIRPNRSIRIPNAVERRIGILAEIPPAHPSRGHRETLLAQEAVD